MLVFSRVWWVCVYIYLHMIYVCVCILFITWYFLVFSSSRLVSFLSYITALGGSKCCPSCLLPLLLSCFHTPEPQRMYSLQVRQNTSPKRSAKILLLQRRFHIPIPVQFSFAPQKQPRWNHHFSPRWMFFLKNDKYSFFFFFFFLLDKRLSAQNIFTLWLFVLFCCAGMMHWLDSWYGSPSGGRISRVS